MHVRVCVEGCVSAITRVEVQSITPYNWFLFFHLFMSSGIQLRLSSLVVRAFTIPLALYNENAFYSYHFFIRYHDTFLAFSPLWRSQDSLHIHTLRPLSGTYFCTTVTEHTVLESL